MNNVTSLQACTTLHPRKLSATSEDDCSTSEGCSLSSVPSFFRCCVMGQDIPITVEDEEENLIEELGEHHIRHQRALAHLHDGGAAEAVLKELYGAVGPESVGRPFDCADTIIRTLKARSPQASPQNSVADEENLPSSTEEELNALRQSLYAMCVALGVDERTMEWLLLPEHAEHWKKLHAKTKEVQSRNRGEMGSTEPIHNVTAYVTRFFNIVRGASERDYIDGKNGGHKGRGPIARSSSWGGAEWEQGNFNAYWTHHSHSPETYSSGESYWGQQKWDW